MHGTRPSERKSRSIVGWEMYRWEAEVSRTLARWIEILRAAPVQGRESTGMA